MWQRGAGAEQGHLLPLLQLARRGRELDAGRQGAQAAPLHRRLGHCGLRDLRVQWLRAVVYQLHQREATAVLQPLYVCAGAGGV